MTTRYLSVFLPRLPTDRLKRRGQTSSPWSGAPKSVAPDQGTETLPLATVSKVKGTQRIVSVDLEAERHAIRPGMALADGRALCPALVVAEADPAAEAALLARLVDCCRRFTPLVAPDGPDGVLLDIGGVAHLFGGEAALLAAVVTELTRQGFGVHGAIGATPEAAWALARFSTCEIAPRNCPSFDRLIADLPLAALRLDAETLRGMTQAGFRRIEDLLLRPRAPLAARFGPKPFQRLDGVLGRTKSAMSPCFEAPAYLAERRFASGITHQGDVVAALLPLAKHLCALLSRHHRGARRMEATLFRVDGAVKRLVIGTSRPTHSPETILALFRERIARLDEEGLDTGYGFDLIRLAVLMAEPLAPVQDALVEDPEGLGGNLAELADRLGARLGLKRVLRFAHHGTHIPEFAVVALPSAQSHPPDMRTTAERGLETVPTRPIRLFDKPEPIDTLAAVPDGPPLRFRWRRVMHEIAAIEGPERISPEWWRDESALTRDYFRAEDREGRRFWLFREGLFNQETTQARWFLHGLFG